MTAFEKVALRVDDAHVLLEACGLAWVRSRTTMRPLLGGEATETVEYGGSVAGCYGGWDDAGLAAWVEFTILDPARIALSDFRRHEERFAGWFGFARVAHWSRDGANVMAVLTDEPPTVFPKREVVRSTTLLGDVAFDHFDLEGGA